MVAHVVIVEASYTTAIQCLIVVLNDADVG